VRPAPRRARRRVGVALRAARSGERSCAEALARCGRFGGDSAERALPVTRLVELAEASAPGATDGGRQSALRFQREECLYVSVDPTGEAVPARRTPPAGYRRAISGSSWRILLQQQRACGHPRGWRNRPRRGSARGFSRCPRVGSSSPGWSKPRLRDDKYRGRSRSAARMARQPGVGDRFAKAVHAIERGAQACRGMRPLLGRGCSRFGNPAPGRTDPPAAICVALALSVSAVQFAPTEVIARVERLRVDGGGPSVARHLEHGLRRAARDCRRPALTGRA